MGTHNDKRVILNALSVASCKSRQLMLPTVMDHLQLASGELIVPLYGVGLFKGVEYAGGQGLCKSMDHGKTWTHGGAVGGKVMLPPRGDSPLSFDTHLFAAGHECRRRFRGPVRGGDSGAVRQDGEWRAAADV